MKKLNYSLRLFGLGDTKAFTEASREELRVLLSLSALDGSFDSEEALCEYAGVSASRCRAALVFWEGEGIILKKDEDGIATEFDERLVCGEIDELPSIKVAEQIRNENLASLIKEITLLTGQDSLPGVDVKNITALVSQYGLSAEFVLTLAAYLNSRSTLTVRRLCNKAIDLQKNECDTVEKLDQYISNLERGYEWEYRRVLGIYGRSLSQSEKEYFKKWSESFGYSSAVISLAYDIAVLNTKDGRGDLRYMDTVLTRWNEAGCKTIADCRSRMDAEKPVKEKARASKSSKSKPETPRYGEFNANEAFFKAIGRSYEKDN